MTDNEIIKALECCINEDNDFMVCGNKGCAFMECKMGKDRECQYYMMKSVLDLINRQKAEIERLQERDETAEKIIREQGSPILYLQDEVSRLNDRLEHWLDESNNKTIEIVKLHHKIQGAKAEAIKEVVEQLEAEVESSDKYIREYENNEQQRCFNKGLREALRVVKEMVGDSE